MFKFYLNWVFVIKNNIFLVYSLLLVHVVFTSELPQQLLPLKRLRPLSGEEENRIASQDFLLAHHELLLAESQTPYSKLFYKEILMKIYFARESMIQPLEADKNNEKIKFFQTKNKELKKSLYDKQPEMISQEHNRLTALLENDFALHADAICLCGQCANIPSSNMTYSSAFLHDIQVTPTVANFSSMPTVAVLAEQVSVVSSSSDNLQTVDLQNIVQVINS